jgi:cob(I)alamin adenosyltransferase
MKIYTRNGDDGNSLLPIRGRISKSEPEFEILGTLDELNSFLGAALAFMKRGIAPAEDLMAIQSDLFDIGAFFATSKGLIDTDLKTSNIEQLIDSYSSNITPLHNFILPGGERASAMLHVARCVCRRAERLFVAWASEAEPGDPRTGMIRYLNRLSDYLFVAARLANRNEGVADVIYGGDEGGKNIRI